MMPTALPPLAHHRDHRHGFPDPGAVLQLECSRFGFLLALALAAMAVVAPVGTSGPPTPAWQQLDPALTGILEGVDGSQARIAGRAPGLVSIHVHAASGVVALRMAATPGERFFGMGERFGSLDLRGQVLHNRTADGMGRPGAPTSYSPTPFLLSSSGYGLQLDTAAYAVVDLTASAAVTIRVAAPDIVVQVLTGPDPATVLTRRAGLVGLPPVPPAWGLGVWKSLIGGPDRVTRDTDELLAAGVPLDAVWVYDAMDGPSGFGWPWPIYGPVSIGHYPDAAALVARLHGRGVKVLGYLSPFVVPGRPGYAQAAARGYLVRNGDSTVFTEPWMDLDRRAYVDFTNPEATRWWQDRVRHAIGGVDIGGVGFDGAMQDFGEDAPTDGRYASGEPGALVRNTYPVRYAQAAREAAQSVKPDATVFFARSGYTGAQAFVTGRFTGDQTRDWSPSTGLPAVLAGMLNGSLSGWPYWGPDIGGFLDGAGARDRELWNRWVQLGALSPVMRDMLGAQADPVGVRTDATTLATFRGYALLHHALVPYLHRLAEQAHASGLPLMRPLWLEHPTDTTAWTVEDEYLLGPEVLVAPVLRPGMTARPVYLPVGRWRDYWTGRIETGPGWVTAPAAGQQIPLFVQAGSNLVLPAPGTLGLPGSRALNMC